MARGMITETIMKKSEEILGYRITQAELRLMPYVHYIMMNGQRLEISKINQSEREILSDWRKKGYIEGGASEMSISKDFWDALGEILWLGYVTDGE